MGDLRQYPEDPDPSWFPRPSYDREPGEGGVGRDDGRPVPEQRPAPAAETARPFGAGLDPLDLRSGDDPYRRTEPVSGVDPYRRPEPFGTGYPPAEPAPGAGGFPGGVYPSHDPLTGPVPTEAGGRAGPSADPRRFPAWAGERTGGRGELPDAAGYDESTSVIPAVGRPAEEAAGYPTARPNPSAVGVYRTRRPMLLLLFAAAAVVTGVPALRLFAAVAFADAPVASGIVPASLLVLGLPCTLIGLFAFVSGGRTVDGAAWLRPPVGYLTVGLALLVAAGLAAS